MVGTGLDGSFVPCAKATSKAASKTPHPQTVMVKTSTDVRIVLLSSDGKVQHDLPT